jgi:hypothetical protein
MIRHAQPPLPNRLKSLRINIFDRQADTSLRNVEIHSCVLRVCVDGTLPHVDIKYGILPDAALAVAVVGRSIRGTRSFSG